MKKTLLIAVAVAIIAGGSAFYGGMKYQASKTTKDRQQMAQPFGDPAGWRGGTSTGRTTGRNLNGRAGGANLVGGEIIAKDDKSITVKLPDRQNPAGQALSGQEGGSKIIFFSESTKITKSAEGLLSDLAIGQTVSVGGKQNSDGSFTAETIQLRPDP